MLIPYPEDVHLNTAYGFKNSPTFIGNNDISEKELGVIYPTKLRRSGPLVHSISVGHRFKAESNLRIELPQNLIAKFAPLPHFALNGIIIPDMTYIRVNIKKILEYLFSVC